MMTAGPPELVVIGRSLDDIMRRVDAASQTPSIQQIAGRALAIRRTVAKWKLELPPETERTLLLQQVLDMHIELMQMDVQPEDESEPTAALRFALNR